MSITFNLVTGDPQGIVASKAFADRLIPGDYFQANNAVGHLTWWTVKWVDMTPPLTGAGGTVACEPGGPPPP